MWGKEMLAVVAAKTLKELMQHRETVNKGLFSFGAANVVK